MLPCFHVKLVHDGGTWTVACGGELDIAASPRLEEAFELCLEMGPSSVVVDCRDLSFIDSAGISSLMRVAHRCLEETIELHVAVSDQVRDILSRAGIAERMLLGPPAPAVA